MRTRRLSLWHLFAALLVVTLSGCSESDIYLAPPPPARGATPLDLFSVATPNYFTLYTHETAPFPPRSQFANEHYPIPISYQASAPGETLLLPFESERGFQVWAQADPRVSIISGVTTDQSRIRLALVERIEYMGMNNILGITRMLDGGSNPRYEVLVATIDPISGERMSDLEIAKTIAHEIGHTLGLGHAPDPRDLMYYQSSSQQGLTHQEFLTYGDAMAIWSTLCDRRINWVQDRPTIQYPDRSYTPAVTRVPAIARVAEGDGVIVCVYTRK